MTETTARIGWLILCLCVVAWECYWLGQNVPHATLSYQVYTLRFNSIGRFVILPLGCWLVLHLMMAPKWLGVRPDWRSLVALGIGFAWASWETWGKR